MSWPTSLDPRYNVITARLTDYEYEALKSFTEPLDVSISQFVRAALMREIGDEVSDGYN